ncbi:MAG: hypothetical protein Kow00127_04190 [Bacteroidales bacterium]
MVNIIDLTPEHEQEYFCCLESPREQMEDAIRQKEHWYREMKEKGLRVKLAVAGDGEIAGLIQYFPVEYSWISGKDLYFISCIWVHSAKNGKVNYQGQGFGKALLTAAIDDVRQLGSKGIVAWGTTLPAWMKASWYRRQGFEKVDSTGLLGDQLLWIPFAKDAVKPKWNKVKQPPSSSNGKVVVTCGTNGWCTAMNHSCHITEQVAGAFGDAVELEHVDLSEPQTMKEWGRPGVFYVGKKKITSGPPASARKIADMIKKELKQKK